MEGVFGELNVPLLENLSLDAQARYDNYSDVGDTVNPKVSLRYQPIQQFTLRASYAEGFHAPTLLTCTSRRSKHYRRRARRPDPCPGGNPVAGERFSRCLLQPVQAITGGNRT